LSQPNASYTIGMTQALLRQGFFYDVHEQLRNSDYMGIIFTLL